MLRNRNIFTYYSIMIVNYVNVLAFTNYDTFEHLNLFILYSTNPHNIEKCRLPRSRLLIQTVNELKN